ncbi:hypothetical protein Hanom_Chr02g00146911 [Helianthus anomalus]
MFCEVGAVGGCLIWLVFGSDEGGMYGADDMGIGAGLVAAVVGFCGGDLGLGNVATGGLLCLNDFLLIEVPMFCTSFSFFIFFSTSFLNTFVLLSFVSFLFCYVSISLSVCLLRVSSIPFFLQVSDFPEDFA